MTDSTMSAGKRLLRYAGAAVFWLLVWQLAAVLVGQELFLPAPWSVVKALVNAAGSAAFWISAGLSVLRVLLGFAAGTLVGALLAVATSASSALDALFAPLIHVIRASPVASFIILVQLWLHTTILPGFIAALMVLPIVWGNLSEGIAKTDRDLLEMGRVYGFRQWKTVRLIYIPSLRPWLRSACLTGLGLAWKSGVAAEVLCQPRRAIGTQLYYSKIYVETDQLFAWTAVVIVLSVLLERLLRRLLRQEGGSL